MRRQETALANACLAGVIAAVFGCVSMTVQAQDLKKYDSAPRTSGSSRRPTGSWATRTRSRRARRPIRASRRQRPGRARQDPRHHQAAARLQDRGVGRRRSQARQMAWGDKGTLFVGTFDKGTVHAVSGPDGQKVGSPSSPGCACRPASPSRTARSTWSISTSSTATTIPRPTSRRRRKARSSTTTSRPTCRTAGSTWCPTARAGSTSPSACPVTSACRRPAPATTAASIPRPAPRRSWRSACATASAARSIPGAASSGSPTTAATGSPTTCRATRSTASARSASISAIPTATRATSPIPSTAASASARSSRRRCTSRARTSPGWA